MSTPGPPLHLHETGEEMTKVIVTGGNRGVGLATARNLAGRGYDLILVCRDRARGEAALESLHSPHNLGSHRVVAADLASLDSVRAAAERIAETGTPIRALVNNAACLPRKRLTSHDGFELRLAVTHLGHFLLTHLLLPRLRAAPVPGRVVTVSSAAHSGPPFNFRDPNFERRRYRRRQAYQQSKLANVLFTLGLARRVAGTGVQAVALHPGVYDTGLLRDYMGRIPGGGIAARIGTAGAEKAGPVVAELAVGRRDEDLNGAYFHKTVRADPSSAARDTGAQERLWSWSAEAVGAEEADANVGTRSDPRSGDQRELEAFLRDSHEPPLR
ncbi:MAG: SDR family NAD(P)-dependent oxidoreductase [Gemmatimonadota bacterium]|nr:SDR family NAD(P)-dependent oxidoreductase [Gemmatimonadota bacterium]